MSDEPRTDAVTGVATVHYAVDDGVATVTLDDPASRNALNATTISGLAGALIAASSDPAVRCVVLTGAGTVFCSGADLRAGGAAGPGGVAGGAAGPGSAAGGAGAAGAAGAAGGSAFAAGGFGALVTIMKSMQNLPKPVVARVQGHVVAGGNGLVAACDVAVAVDSATFAFTEVRLGLAPAMISVVCLPKLRPVDAAALFLGGERVSAQRVADAGMVTEVVPAEGLDGAVAGYTSQFRLASPQGLAATKQLLARVPSMARDEAYAWTAELSAGLFASEEAAEGMAAFRDKRPPRWAHPLR